MNNFLPLKGNCPVCNGTRKDCRQSKQTGLVFCRDSEANPPDYIFRVQDKHGFGIWAEKATVEAASQQQREEWRQQHQLEKQRRLDAERHQRSRLLSEPDRDREIRKLLAQSDLCPQHRENLRQRGLSDEQIQAGMFRSVGQWQKLETEISHRLAGVNIDGRSLTNYQAGLLCPIWNPQRQIIGWQLRLDNTDNGKYRWPTSTSKKRPNAPTAHLTNGELPLTCCRPFGETKKKGLFLAEGILKAQITAQLSGRITIGAAGGNFASSPSTLKAYLVELEPEIGGKPIALCPDAGAILNDNVMRQYQRTHDLLKELGHKVNVLWWRQTSKDDLDLDDMLAAGRGDEIEEITWEKFKAIARDANNFWKETTSLFQNLKQRVENSFKGFGTPPSPTPPEPNPEPNPTPPEPNPEPNPTPPEPNSEPNPKPLDYLVYVPGCLPKPEGYIALGCPRIKFKEGQRQALWREAVKKGFFHILDKSAPGTGKSHTAGVAKPKDFGAEKLVYFAANHRNPTTLPIEKNYWDLPVRNAGMAVDKTRKTPMGKDYIVRPKPKEGKKATIPGNCNRQGLFEVMWKKNIFVEGRENPICTTCHLQNVCSRDTGEGFGFKCERKETLEGSLIRAHPNSAPNPNDPDPTDKKDDDKFDFSKVGNFWDEAGTLINAVQDVTVELADLDQIMGLIESKLPAIHKALKEPRLVLRQLLNEEIKQPHYGFDDSAIRDLLPPPPENLSDIISELEAELQPDFSSLNSTEEYDVEMEDLPDEVKKRFRERPSELIEDLEKSIPLNWLVPFLKVWNKEPGALRCKFGKLTICRRDDRHSDIAEASKFNIYLDATIRPDDLALLLDIEPENILVIEQDVPNYNNLRIIQITGMNRLGKKRSEFLINRVDALKTELTSRHPQIILLDWKGCASEGEKSWFVDSRGSNDFINRQVIASFGIPCQNLGSLQSRYQTLTGRQISLDKNNPPDPGFQAFVDAQTQAEIIQAIGRLRAERRPNEQLTYYFAGDYDLSFLEVPIEQMEACTITPKAGNAKQQTEWTLMEVAKQIVASGNKLTQSVLAKAAGISQGRVSQVMKELGGWRTFQKLLAALLDSFNSPTNNLSDLPEDEILMAKNYLPSVIDPPPEDMAGSDTPIDKVKKVVEIAKIFHETFDSILAALPLESKSKLLNLLVCLMPGEVQARIGTALSTT
ncbi:MULTISPECIES: hypothetical protein [Cyanophyceae]|uniref:hypothetical protein n=1 Tax=Cyanophyceae TaxID=3028117 RepID=UPI0016840AE1|nr:hypothetical protein [Trichocoleus sp. FACHB-40]MBD2007074.1 hypothetical protein [Trichocoleus sp. FACHB-40]